MNAEPALYTIRVDGQLGAIALSAFPALSLAAEQQCTCTVLVGRLDRSALYGVLAQLEMLGLDLLELSRSGSIAPGRRSDGPGGTLTCRAVPRVRRERVRDRHRPHRRRRHEGLVTAPPPAYDRAGGASHGKGARSGSTQAPLAASLASVVER